MLDSSQRSIKYLRLSITKACAMRCVYCRPESLTNSACGDQLTADELVMLVEHLATRHGLKKVRITGGEPTSRPDLLEIIGRLAAIAPLQELALTTNGLTLARDARAMVAAGLDRVNISIDSLDAQRFAHVTGIDALPRVLAGIDAAIAARLSPVKLNTVVLRDQNLDELPQLVRFAAEKQVEIRFIELMPMGPLAREWSRNYVPESEMRQRLESLVQDWQPQRRNSGAARSYHATLTSGQTAAIGFITAMSCPFCDQCDRLRIASDGTFFPCLMDRPAGSLLAAIRPRFDPVLLDQLLLAGLQQKAPEHPATGIAVMTHLGG